MWKNNPAVKQNKHNMKQLFCSNVTKMRNVGSRFSDEHS